MPLKVVNHGEQNMLEAILGVGYTLRLFKSNTTPVEATVAADLTESNFTGYSAKALTGGSWAVVAGDPTVGTYAQQSFTSSADQTSQLVYGYFITRTSDGRLQWVERFSSPITIQYNNDSIRITPRITLQDTTD